MTWVGPTEGNGAYPRINRAMIAALRKSGWTVVENFHNLQRGRKMTPVLVNCTYPPQRLKVKHDISICISTWEFLGQHSTPQTFLDAFEDYDMVWAMCGQAAHSFRDSGLPTGKLTIGRLGVNYEFSTGDEFLLTDADWREAKKLLFVGGSDLRHGIDIAMKTLEMLPDAWRMIWKVTPGYPVTAYQNKRLMVITDDLNECEMADLYRMADIFFYPIRSAAPGMPLMEAFAHGIPVVATDVEAVREIIPEFLGDTYEAYPRRLVTGIMEPMRHHIHADCLPLWTEADPKMFVADILSLAEQGRVDEDLMDYYRRQWSWDIAAGWLEATIEILAARMKGEPV